jgi:hypothetical protein
MVEVGRVRRGMPPLAYVVVVVAIEVLLKLKVRSWRGFLPVWLWELSRNICWILATVHEG